MSNTYLDVNEVINYLGEIDGFKIVPSSLLSKGALNYKSDVVSAQLNGVRFTISASYFGVSLFYYENLSIHERLEIRKVKKKLAEWHVFQNTDLPTFCVQYSYNDCVATNYSFGAENLKMFLEERMYFDFKRFHVSCMANKDKAMSVIMNM